MYSLIFFALIAGCKVGSKKDADLQIAWEKDKAVGIYIPEAIIPGVDPDSLSQVIQVRILGSKQSVAMLGDFKIKDDTISFRPLIPLTQGQKYEISYYNKPVGSITVPIKTFDAPRMVAIYPTADTLPENLLKIYLLFSRPMREGQSGKYIAMLNEKNDTVPGVFLLLEPELWNHDRTVLTMWLDPGRIKRGLQPNEQKGNPLTKGKKYTVAVSDKWPDASGRTLAKPFLKSFIADKRDGRSPEIGKWMLILPTAGSNGALKIIFNEPLDYFLLNETISITDQKGEQIDGTLNIRANGRTIAFRPLKQWQSGTYALVVQPALEDMAGNNMKRLFDNDLQMKQDNENATKKIFQRSFSVK